MQDGDLAVWDSPRYVVILEGVLCDHSPITVPRRLRSDKTIGFNLSWHDAPLKRLIYLKQRWPDTQQEIVTFLPEQVADEATEYLDAARVSYDRLTSQPFDTWVRILRYQSDLRGIYDSSPARLDKYGQLGIAVHRGQDFG